MKAPHPPKVKFRCTCLRCGRVVNRMAPPRHAADPKDPESPACEDCQGGLAVADAPCPRCGSRDFRAEPVTPPSAPQTAPKRSGGPRQGGGGERGSGRGMAERQRGSR